MYKYCYSNEGAIYAKDLWNLRPYSILKYLLYALRDCNRQLYSSLFSDNIDAQTPSCIACQNYQGSRRQGSHSTVARSVSSFATLNKIEHGQYGPPI